MMRMLQRNTATAQIPQVRVVPVSLRNASSYAGSLFTLLTSNGLFEGFFGLYLYLYFYLYSNDRWWRFVGDAHITKINRFDYHHPALKKIQCWVFFLTEFDLRQTELFCAACKPKTCYW